MLVSLKKIINWVFKYFQNASEPDKKDKEINKTSGSPYEKKDEVNGNAPQTNGHATNGLADDDKTFK